MDRTGLTGTSGRGSLANLSLHDPDSEAQRWTGLGVCVLSSDVDAPTGAMQRPSLRLLEELSARGVDVSLCTRNRYGKARDETRGGVRIHRAPGSWPGWRIASSGLYLADGLAWLARNRSRFDVLHGQHGFDSAVLATLAGRMLGKPVVVRVAPGGSGRGAARRKRPSLSWRLRRLRGVNRWVAHTPETLDELRSLGVETDRVVMIPSSAAIPAERAYRREDKLTARLRLGLCEPRIAVYAGRLTAQKGLDTLLDAWRLVRAMDPHAHLYLLGSGSGARSVEPELRRQTRRHGLEDVVHFRGHVSNVEDYLLAANLFVLPTRARRRSDALVEALAAGAAVVTTGTPCNRGLVAHGENGLLVPEDDAGALARAVAELFAKPALAVELGQRARAGAERRLSLEATASRYLELYREVRREARHR